MPPGPGLGSQPFYCLKLGSTQQSPAAPPPKLLFPEQCITISMQEPQGAQPYVR